YMVPPMSHHIRELSPAIIESKRPDPNFGATFKLTLDTAPKADAKAELDSSSRSKPPKPLRVLLVENHRDTRRMLSRLLTHFGHQVLTADNVRSALDIVASGEIYVLICDIGLPDGSGYEVVSQTRRARTIKVV